MADDVPAPAAAQPSPVGSRDWWLGGEGIKFLLQVVALLFMVVALIVIAVLFFRGGDERFKFLSEISAAQGLIAGVLLTTIVLIEIVAIMTALFGGADEPLKDRIQMVRDILAPLLAIFGTVTGFYFGTKAIKEAPQATAPANPAPPQPPR